MCWHDLNRVSLLRRPIEFAARAGAGSIRGPFRTGEECPRLERRGQLLQAMSAHVPRAAIIAIQVSNWSGTPGRESLSHRRFPPRVKDNEQSLNGLERWSRR